MDLVVAAAPFEDFIREHSPILAAGFLLLLALLVVRLVIKAMTRVVLLGTITLIALFVMVERDSISECTRTCECDIGGVEATLPLCDRARI